MAIRLQHPRNVGIGVKDTFSGKEKRIKRLRRSTLVLTFTKASQALPERLMPGESTTIAFDSVIAPKQWDQLSSVTPALDSVVLLNLWDWFRWICFAIWQLLNFLFTLSGKLGHCHNSDGIGSPHSDHTGHSNLPTLPGTCNSAAGENKTSATRR